MDNNCNCGFVCNSKILAEIAREDTLLLMLESVYAERVGYSNPSYKLVPLIESTFKNAPGRIFIALESLDVYNIQMISKLATKLNRKIIPYDRGTEIICNRVSSIYEDNKSSTSMGTIDDAMRMPPKEVMILVSGFGTRIYHKISLLGCGQHDDKRLKLLPDDTFIMGLHASNSTELLASEAIDELYHNDMSKIVYFKKNQFIKMHASEEDIKTMLAMFRPKYYMPISGTYKKLLANAMIAVDMNINLNYTNVFILDNGMILDILDKGAFIAKEKVLTGEMFIDGFNSGTDDLKTLEDRKVLGDDGVVVIGAIISSSSKRIVYGPDVQTRGLVFVKDSETLVQEIERVSLNVINEESAKESINIKNIETQIKDQLFKLIRRATNKSPMIIPMITIEK